MADDLHNPADIAPLVRYAGAVPPAPAWFEAAVSAPCDTAYVEVDGASIHYRRWGDPTKPGLLLVHGNGAHAHWYDFIAPLLADTYCVAALTFGGMGDSAWRDAYTVETFTAEQLAVCAHAGFFDGGRKPVIVAHSFGGFITMHTGARHGERFSGIMIVDSPVRPPEDKWDGPPERNGPTRIYADLKSALARFRLAPPQPCENHFIVDYIARHSLKQVEAAPGRIGWTWKFDGSIWRRFDGMLDPKNIFQAITSPLAIMRGADSVLIPDRTWDYMQGLRADMDVISLPAAQHHVMLDQPLAFVEAVRTQLAAWGY